MPNEKETLRNQYQQVAQQVLDLGMHEMIAKLTLIELQRKIEALPPEAPAPAPEAAQPQGDANAAIPQASATSPDSNGSGATSG